MRKYDLVTLISTIAFLFVMVAYATYAALSPTTNINNLNINSQTTNGVVFTATGGSSYETTVNMFVMQQAAANSVVATASDNITITLQTDGVQGVCCSYDIDWIWDTTSVTANRYKKTSGATNEYVVSGTPTKETYLNTSNTIVSMTPKNSSFSKQLPDYNASALQSVIYSGTICNNSVALTTKATQNYSIKTEFYNLPIVQDQFKGATFNGAIKIQNIVCTNG